LSGHLDTIMCIEEKDGQGEGGGEGRGRETRD
jgi:hypothetical protein